ncbi:MAG: hypothetical protein GY811_26945 [Myxococcales bacterium]|nr:hypothetical protein [Myxococcales bacterium]
MSSGRLITVSGTDCSGKTTQIDLLVDALAKRGHSVKRLWFRPGYSQEMDFLRRALRSFIPKALPKHGNTEARQAIFRKQGVSQSWVAMALVDTFLQYALRVRALLAQGHWVICDRFVMDAALDLHLRFPELDRIHRPSLALIERGSPTPLASFLLHVPYDVVSARSEVKAEPFPDSEALRLERWRRYQAMKDLPQVLSIDSDRPIPDVRDEILSYIRTK